MRQFFAYLFGFGASNVEPAPKRLRPAEWGRIVRDGETLLSSEESRQRGFYNEEQVPIHDKVERRLVRLEGRHYVCCLFYKATTRKVGRKKVQVPHDCHRPDGRYRTIEVELEEPTGEFEPPRIEWLTDSWPQFRKEEREIIRHQRSE